VSHSREYRSDVDNKIFIVLRKAESPQYLRDLIEAVQIALEKMGVDTAARNTVITHLSKLHQEDKIKYVNHHGIEVSRRSRNSRIVSSDRYMYHLNKISDNMIEAFRKLHPDLYELVKKKWASA